MSENQMKLVEDLGVTNFGTYNARFGLYECPICKKHFKARSSDVKMGKSTKCRSCAMIIKNTTHWLTNHKLHIVWTNIKSRVFNKKDKCYKDYGDRGIVICDEWKNDFMSFYNWSIDNGYQSELTIDRINNDGNYEPLNCRWTTKSVQSQNTRRICSRNTSGYRGVSYSKNYKKYISQIKVMNKSIKLGLFDSALEAAITYDKYVIDNNLEHTRNNVYIITKDEINN